MKKSIAVLLMVGMVALAGKAFAASDNETAGVNLSVNSVFALTLTGGNAGGFNFGARNAGDTFFDILGLNVVANKGAEWTLTLNAAALTHSDSVTTMPAGSFKYKIAGPGGIGTYVPDNDVTETNMPASATTIFTAGSGVFNTAGTDFNLVIVVNIPAAQKTGAYSSTLNISLVDAL